jgi:hypothetical protein
MGYGIMLEALRVREDGTPRLRFLDCCEESIDSIPTLPTTPHDPNDIDTNTNDHCYDETRYCVVMLTDGIEERRSNTATGKNKPRNMLEVFIRTGVSIGNKLNFWKAG